MKSVPALWLCLSLAGTGGWYALAEDVQATHQPVPAFYTWLEKYQNPSVSHVPRLEKSMVPRSEMTAAEDPPVSLELGGESTGMTDLAETAGPGEGLGCFYHRSYYSHLPLFKEGLYTLPGSLNVAEPYRKPSGRVLAAPGEPPR